MQYAMPVLEIRSYQDAVAFYVDWLGFRIDWEWRSSKDSPVYMQISRDGLYLRLNSYQSDGAKHCAMVVDDLEAYVHEWKTKCPDWQDEMRVVDLGNPKPAKLMDLEDPFGNTLAFQEGNDPRRT